MIEKYVKTIKYNIKFLIIYEFVYMLFSSLLIIPISVFLYDFVGKNQIFYSFASIFLITIIISLSLLLIIFNKINIITIIDKSKHKKDITVKDVLVISACKLSRLLSNYKVFIMYLCLLPFLYFTFIGFFTIKYFNYHSINVNWFLTVFSIYLIIALYSFKYIYSIYYLLIDGKNTKNSNKASINLIKNSLAIDISKLLVIQICAIPLLLLMIYIYDEMTLRIAISNIILKNFVNFLIWLLNAFIITIYIILLNVVVSTMFYNHKKENKERCKQINISSKIHQINLAPKTAFFVSIIFSVLLCSNYIYQNMTIDPIEPKITEVTAHRGDNMNYPENTMAAFTGAVKENATWIEIDVRQTKDQKLVIFHDENLYRITGVNKNVIDVTYDELKKLDYGSFFSTEYSNEKIPLLSEVISFAKENNVKLNIELKNTGREVNFEEQVINIINKYDFADYCIVESPMYRQIRKIKRLNPNVRTALLTVGIANEDIINLTDIDAISIDVFSVNNYLIDEIHRAGKEVFVWTLNDENIMNKLIASKVDNIITDNVLLANKKVKEWKDKQVDY